MAVGERDKFSRLAPLTPIHFALQGDYYWSNVV